jgi:hypothetical protein
MPRSLAKVIAGVPGGAAIDRRAPTGGVLSHVRHRPQLAQLHDEVAGTIAFVGAHGDRPRSGALSQQACWRRRWAEALIQTGHHAPRRRLADLDRLPSDLDLAA